MIPHEECYPSETLKYAKTQDARGFFITAVCNSPKLKITYLTTIRKELSEILYVQTAGCNAVT